MIIHTKQDGQTILPQPEGRKTQLYRNIDLDTSNLICIAGRPGMGKTSLALSLAQEYAEKTTKSIYFFSLEYSAKSIYDRFIISMADVDSYAFRVNAISDVEQARVELAKKQISKMNLIIDDTPLITPEHIEKTINNFEDVGMIVIDYFQLLWPDQQYGDRDREYEEIALKLKRLSRVKEIPVIFTSHLPRYVEYRQDKRPLLSDLKGAGVPVQVVDTVCLIYREGYYDTNSDNNSADVIIAKNQYGSSCIIPFEC